MRLKWRATANTHTGRIARERKIEGKGEEEEEEGGRGRERAINYSRKLYRCLNIYTLMEYVLLTAGFRTRR